MQEDNARDSTLLTYYEESKVKIIINKNEKKYANLLTWFSLLQWSLRKKIMLKSLSMVRIFPTKITCILESIKRGALHYKSEQSKRFESKI